MGRIHETAVVHALAEIGEGVTIGPFAVVGKAKIGAGCVVHPHVIISDGVEVGNDVEIFSGALIGREPKGAGATARTLAFQPFVRIGSGCSISAHAIVYYDVEIGPNTLIADGASVREKCRIGSRCIIGRYVTVNYETTIGDRVKIMDLTHITGNMIIEDDVFISLLVGTANDRNVTDGFGDHVVGPSIGQGAVIGVGATLLPAVKIGAGARVAAASLVARDVEANSSVAGSPARPVPPRPPR